VPPTSPRPPSSPPLLPGQRASISGDPHIHGAHGDRADFKGADGGVYSALSARNFSLNIKIVHDNFTSPHSKLNVQGSWIRAALHAVRTARTGRRLQIFFHAKDPHRAIVTEGCTAPYCKDAPPGVGRRTVVKEGAPDLVVENVRVRLVRKTLLVANGQWLTSSHSTWYYPHPRKLRMDVAIEATYQEHLDPVAPHGLLGQTYDRDRIALHGRLDDYSRLDDGKRTVSRKSAGGTVTTRAKAEGAVEGDSEDYRVASDFATVFRFSRFDAVSAPPRNASALGGVRVRLRPSLARSTRSGPSA